MGHPYKNLPLQNFWKLAVANRHASDIPNLFSPKFGLFADEKIAFAGSCFAQHLKFFLEKCGVSVLDTEPFPEVSSPQVLSPKEFGYGIFSARYGNIYTPKQLVQLAEEALNNTPRDAAEIIWKKGDRFVDALRPMLEPTGFHSEEELMTSRAHHIKRVRQLLRKADVFIFTLGLTEAWRNKETQLVYPLAPGVNGGEFDTSAYEFVNFGFEETLKDMKKFIRLFRRNGPEKRVLLTVSPVPLSATYESQNVLLSTFYSKSVLRAVAGSLQSSDLYVDYFPSYEIIVGPNSRYSFFKSDMRNIHKSGIATVMEYFSEAYPELFHAAKPDQPNLSSEEIFCEEILLGGL